MTREAQASNNFLRINGGLNTEINELTFPSGFTRDEANYELLLDGSRKRRKGLAIESGASAAKTVQALTTTQVCQTYLWRDAGGNTDVDLLVYRQGSRLYFATADSIVSDGWYTQSIDLAAFNTSGATTANTDDVAVSFTQGRGYLFVTGLYMNPIYIEFDGTTTFTAVPIQIRIRDYIGISDGTGVAEKPVGTVTEDHRYNLRNRGWPQEHITTYSTTLAKYPSKNMVWYTGFRREYDSTVGVNAEDPTTGTRAWDENKIDAEGFGSSSAPEGSLFLDIRDTTNGLSTGASVGVVGISTWTKTADPTASTWEILITTDANHGMVMGPPDPEITISGQSSRYSYFIVPLEPDNGSYSFDGVYTITAVPNTDEFKIIVDQPYNWDVSTGGTWTDQYNQLGTLDTDSALPRSSGTAHADAPRACAFHGGRMFYAGMQNQEFADYVFFSQLGLGADKFEKCHQEADPTDENFNALTPADGGYIVIPGMSGVLNMLSVRDSLLIFTKEGVWEVGGGQRGVFTADGYSVRKVTSESCNAVLGQALVEDSVSFTGPGGIFLIAPNQYTGVLEVQPVIEQTIQSLWNDIPVAQQEGLQMFYDSSLRRMYYMYGAGIGIDTMLIYDSRASAWFKFTFTNSTNNELVSGFALPNLDTTSNSERLKFIYVAGTSTTVQVADFNQTTFNDWHGANGPLPYLVFGHDNLGEWQSRKQAPLITVHSKRTETGYTSSGGGWVPVNESSTLLTAYWDWVSDATNEADTNKISSQQEVYRHVRQFVPGSANDLDGYPIVTTRNKIRGRGRAIQLRFDGATDKDSHILGYTTNYKVSRRK